LRQLITKGPVSSSPAIGSDGTVYVGSSDKYLYAINPNGSQKWRFLTGDAVHSSPAIGTDGTIYVGSDDGYLYAISPIADTDGDGMPDDWEIANGLNPLVNDANLDKDGDSFTNFQEYIAGTNPNDPNSIPNTAKSLPFIPLLLE
jgi:hypothetical protein